jgi:hypothetical protein
VPGYGYGWQPTVVAVDWAPYRYGRWSWVRPWGWTWIDDARWGFATSHYGRWTCYRDRWIWLPGHRSPRPVWAPALVAFVGGRNWNFSFGIGARPAVAWFPLGPGEFYCPSYRASARYLRNLNARNVNITNFNVTNFNVTNAYYSNRGVAGAMTAVPREMFVASQSVRRVGVAVPRNTAEQTPVVGHAVPVTPDATSVIGRLAASAPRPPLSVMRRAVVARTEPPPAGTQAAPVVSVSRRPTSDADRARLAEPNGSVATQAPAASESGATARPRGEQATPDSLSRPATDRTAQPSQQMFWPQAPQGERTTSGTSWRPAPGRTEQSTPQPEAPRTTPSERAVPRSDTSRYQAPSYQAPSYQAPRYQYEAPRPQATPRDERPAQNSERVAPREERPAPGRDVRETPAPERSARPRTEERSQDRPAAPAHADRPAAAPAQSARPAERAAERPQPKSGGQSDQSAKPRGGRGGDR